MYDQLCSDLAFLGGCSMSCMYIYGRVIPCTRDNQVIVDEWQDKNEWYFGPMSEIHMGRYELVSESENAQRVQQVHSRQTYTTLYMRYRKSAHPNESGQSIYTDKTSAHRQKKEKPASALGCERSKVREVDVTVLVFKRTSHWVRVAWASSYRYHTCTGGAGDSGMWWAHWWCP